MEMNSGRYEVTSFADLKNAQLHMRRANAIARLPEEPSVVSAGEEVDIHLLRGEFAMLEEMEGMTTDCEQILAAVPDEKRRSEGKVRMVQFQQRTACLVASEGKIK
jgi:molybdopterin molybdotransferase